MHFKIKSPPLRHPPPPSALSLRPPLSSLLPSYFRDRSYGHPPNKAPGTRRHQAQGTRHKAPGTRHQAQGTSQQAPLTRHHGVRAGRGRSPETASVLGLASRSGAGSAGGGEGASACHPSRSRTWKGRSVQDWNRVRGPAAAMSAPTLSPLPPPLPAQPRANCHNTSKTLLSATDVVVAVVVFFLVLQSSRSNTYFLSHLVLVHVASTGASGFHCLQVL